MRESQKSDANVFCQRVLEQKTEEQKPMCDEVQCCDVKGDKTAVTGQLTWSAEGFAGKNILKSKSKVGGWVCFSCYLRT